MIHLPAINPLRTAALLVLAGTISFVTFQILQPQTIAYVQVREGVTLEAGQVLQWEHVDTGELTFGGTMMKDSVLPPGLIAWTEIETYLGVPLSRPIHGPSPLLTSDFERNGASALDLPADETLSLMSIPVDNVSGVTPELSRGDRVHLYASFEDEQGAHSGMLFRDMPVVAVQRELDGSVTELVAVSIALTMEEAVLLTHALHYGKIRLSKALVQEKAHPGIGDRTFANALMKTQKRWERKEAEAH
ncbi:MAG: pilus assembly protein CpaB [Brevibacillus sp.]|nr:pilus assembly protein CpaB [Brevibacillus sp.]